MTQFESSVKAIPHPVSVIFNFLSDFDHFESLLPNDKVSNWKSAGDTCSFSVSGIGEIGLKIVEREFPKTIKYGADVQTPVNFFLWVQLKEVSENDTRLKVTLRAELNMMMKMVASAPLKKFVDVLADAMAGYAYSL
ncbi:MAG: hypothetical protein LBV41_02255 [Cytophagaceae bacterium]|jgi:carbon monoxide dehydrogenase subunit G|nr:hypothetical protein [Cytophagaceae bacterium]